MEFSPLIEVEEEAIEIKINNNTITNFSQNDLGVVKINTPLPIEFTLCDGTIKNTQLIFTRHPIVQLETNNQFIHNEPKIPFHLRINDPDFLENGRTEQEYFSLGGIELRGGGAQVYPKKSYGIELWNDSLGVEKKDASLLGMREDDDWILDAMFIDKARMRNRVATELWVDLENLHYQNVESEARSGVRGKMVEVFLDGEYWGIYFLSERMDRKQLQLQEDGLLYKSTAWDNGVIRFENYSSFDASSETWEGWLQKYPDPDEEILWNPLADFTFFAVESSNEDFKDQIGNMLHIDNAVDYFIFMNLLRADDNAGKNIYFGKYNSSDRFFISAWDLDATLGRDFLGEETLVEDILTYGLFDRLLETDADDFFEKVKTRWGELRGSIFSKNNLMDRFYDFADAMEMNGSFEREKSRWGLESDLSLEMGYVSDWLDGRLGYLDATW